VIQLHDGAVIRDGHPSGMAHLHDGHGPLGAPALAEAAPANS
jgi:hypothetical protein